MSAGCNPRSIARLAQRCPIDGVMSAAVRDAIRDFQRKNRLPVSGYIGPDTEAALRRVGGGSESRRAGVRMGVRADRRRVELRTARCRRARPCRSHLPSSRSASRTIPGLYRVFHHRWPGFYTGKATDLRRRISPASVVSFSFGVRTKGHRLVLYRMPGKTGDQVRRRRIRQSTSITRTTSVRLNKVSRVGISRTDQSLNGRLRSVLRIGRGQA